MLVLSRKIDEAIQIGDDVTITIIKVKGNTVRLGISAPKDVRVQRAELILELDGMEDSLEVADGTAGDGASSSPEPSKAEHRSKPQVSVIKTGPHRAVQFETETLAPVKAVNPCRNRLQEMAENQSRLPSNPAGDETGDIKLSGLTNEPYEVHFLRFPGTGCSANS